MIRHLAAALFALALSVLHVGHSYADEAPSDDVAEQMIEAFSNCAGLFDTISDHIEDTEPEAAAYYREVGNGAWAATVMSALSETDGESAMELANNLRGSRQVYWAAMIRVDGIQSQRVVNALEFCASINNVQVELVKEFRRLIYGLE